MEFERDQDGIKQKSIKHESSNFSVLSFLSDTVDRQSLISAWEDGKCVFKGLQVILHRACK